jgi:site-specific DNA-methyltransferase (cytosine-N4-specific)
MPESVQDRPAKTHAHVFLCAPGPRDRFDLDAIRAPHSDTTAQRTAPHRAHAGKAAREGLPYVGTQMSPQTLRLSQAAHPLGRNPGDVWTFPTQPFPEAHFAVMAPALAERCILAGCKPGGVVLDPFCGSGTTGMVAQQHGRRFVGIDLNRDYLDLALRTRLNQTALIDATAITRRDS